MNQAALSGMLEELRDAGIERVFTMNDPYKIRFSHEGLPDAFGHLRPRYLGGVEHVGGLSILEYGRIKVFSPNGPTHLGQGPLIVAVGEQRIYALERPELVPLGEEIFSKYAVASKGKKTSRLLRPLVGLARLVG